MHHFAYPLHPMRTSSFRKNSEGSALLLTVLVVSLLMVLVLGFVVMVRMEQRRTANRQQLFEARANAVLGANLAIARLQETVGPDTRVTAPTKDLEHPTDRLPPYQRLVGMAIDSAPYVYSESGDLVFNESYAQPVGYFISTDDPNFDPLSLNPFEEDGDVKNGFSLLVGPGSVSATQDENSDNVPDGYVAAPVVGFDTDSDSIEDGGFAWWISDDGLKAQVNLTDQYHDPSEPGYTRERAITAQRTGTEIFFPTYDPEDPAQKSLLNRVVSPPQLSLTGIESVPGQAKGYFHDITTTNTALFTNTKRGGLMKDLTAVMTEAEADSDGGVGGPQWDQLMDYQASRILRYGEETQALESYTGEPHSNDLSSSRPAGVDVRHWNALQVMTLREDQVDTSLNELIFPPMTDLHPQFDPGGAHWEQLITWATLKQQHGTDPVPVEPRWQHQAALSPVIAKVNLASYVTMDPGDYEEAGVHFIPTVVLWNPYSVPITNDTGNPWRVRIDYDSLNVFHWLRLQVSHPAWVVSNERPTDTYGHITSGPTPHRLWTPRFLLRFDSNLSDNFVFELYKSGSPAGSMDPEIVIPPGEARIFTMKEHKEKSYDSNFEIDPTVALTEGLAEDGQYSFYVVENIRDQIFDHPHPEYDGVNNPGSGPFEGIHGYNYWQRSRTGFAGGGIVARPHPFPLDPTHPNFTGDPSSLLSYSSDFPSICINNTGLDNWTIHKIGIEVSSTEKGIFKSMLRNYRITLDDGDPVEPNILSQIIHPNQQLPAALYGAQVYDDPPILATWEPSPTPSDETPFTLTNSFPSFPSWGLAVGLRLPDNSLTEGNSLAEEKGNFSPIRWLTDFNPTAPFQQRDPESRMADAKWFKGTKGGFDSAPLYTGGFYLSDPGIADTSIMTDEFELSQFIGNSDYSWIGEPGESPRAILYELPESSEDLASIASFMHAPLMPTFHDLMPAPQALPGEPSTLFDSPLASPDRKDLPYALAESQVNYGVFQPVNSIGNSRASLFVDRARAEQSFYPSVEVLEPGETIPYASSRNPNSFEFRILANHMVAGPPPSYFPGYDSSWVYNEVLFDDFFLSPESNSRLVWSSGTEPEDRDFNSSAETLSVKGAFNVNSVSIPAWAGLLASMLEVDLGAGGGSLDSSAMNRFIDPFNEALYPGEGYESSKAYTGYRRLTPEQIWDDNGSPNDFSDDTGLAPRIVDQVSLRGPFLSMSDFINRGLLPYEESDPSDPSTPGPFEGDNLVGLAGALQTAIDAWYDEEDGTDIAGLNDDMGSEGEPDSWIDPANDMNNVKWDNNSGVSDVDAFFSLHTENAIGRRNSGAPGELTQADILARIGAALRPRSDTFTIRATGITGDTATPQAVAWCEMTVQRVPEFVDPADAASAAPSALTRPTNQFFGRRFEVIGFRWLSQEEL
jgi:hypothetical protein